MVKKVTQQQQQRRQRQQKLLNTNLCMTSQDITDDAGKTVTRVANIPTNLLFQTCLTNIVRLTPAECTIDFRGEMQRIIDTEVTYQVSLNRKSKQIPRVINIPIAQSPIPTVVSSGINEVVICYDDDDIQGGLEKQRKLAQIKSVVRDNASGTPLPEEFTISSVYDEAAKIIRCGRFTLSQWLTNKYGALNIWTLNLSSNGITTTQNSVLSAQWGANIQCPVGAIMIGMYLSPLTLESNEVLFTLRMGNNFVGCIFSLIETVTQGEYTYSNSGVQATKTPVFFYFQGLTIPIPRVQLTEISNVIKACFSGNPTKNAWFNYNVANSGNPLYIIFGCLILIGKAVGDASFAFTCSREQLCGTNDYTTCTRMIANDGSVSFCKFEQTHFRANIYIVIIPFLSEPQKSVLIGISNNKELKLQRNIRKKKVYVIEITDHGLRSRGQPTARGIRRERRAQRALFHQGGGGGDDDAVAEVDDDAVAEVDDDDETDKDSEALKELKQSTEYFQKLLESTFNPLLTVYRDYLVSVVEKLKSLSKQNNIYILDDESKQVDILSFNIGNKILSIETIINFINKLMEISVENLAIAFIKSFTKQDLRIPEPTEIFNTISRLAEFNLFVTNPKDPKFICSLPACHFIYEFYQLYLLLMNGSDEGDTKLFDDNIFNPLLNSIKEQNSTIYKFFADTNSLPISIKDLPIVKDSNVLVVIKNLLHSIQNYGIEKYSKEDDINEYEQLTSNIEKLLSESSEMEKYKIYKELSFILYALNSFINTNTMSFMIVSCFTDNKLVAQCITNELITLTSIHGVSIFDLQIIESFIDGIVINNDTGSISYPKGYEGLYTLITIKKIIDGDLIESLNDTGFSLKQIGDFVDNVSFESEEKSLSNEEITQLVETSITEKYELIQAYKQEQQLIEPVKTRQLVTPVSGGNNNTKSKHKLKYRKKYKKFVSKYIIKKNKKQNKNKNKSTHCTKNKTKKNKKLAKNKSKSKYANKTLKNKKRKSKSSNRKSKNNNKAKTYNLYKHNKTLKH